MLCTDGLYDMVQDGEIAARLQRTEQPVEQVVHGLIAAANAAGGRDNVTVVLARF
jgi:protein phosphatase